MNKFSVLKGLLIVFILLSFCRESLAQENRSVNFVFEGNKVFSSAELLNVLEKCRNDVQKGSNKGNIDTIIDWCLRKSVLNYMFYREYLTAKIGDLRKERNEQIIIPLTEGQLYYLGEVIVDGETVFTEKNILKSLLLKKGEVINRSLIFQWISSLEDIYANKGFIQFLCEPEPTFAENIVNLKLKIDEGRAFKIGRIEFVADKNVRNELLRKYLTFKEGDTFNKQKLQESIKKLNGLNQFQQIDFDKDIEFVSNEEIPVVNLKINIKKKEQ